MLILVTHLAGSGPKQSRSSRRVTGTSFDIGRGSRSHIVLPDHRVQLDHARIVEAGREARIEAARGRVYVNGKRVDSATLGIGDRVRIGPYRLDAVEAPAGVALALDVRMEAPRIRGWRRVWLTAYLGLPRLSRRRLSYLAFCSVLLLFLVLPMLPDLVDANRIAAAHGFRKELSAAASSFMQAWNPGPVSPSHRVFAGDCRACHTSPFVAVSDRACMECHRNVSEHVAPTRIAGEAVAGQRCTACHGEHRGAPLTPRGQQLCVDCHGDIERVSPEAESADVRDFAAVHAAFRLSLLDAADPPRVRRASQDSGSALPLEEHSNLKFNHALHLDPAGVRDPEGRRNPIGARNLSGNRTVLKCASCHEAGLDGRLMQPVNMERHCRSCHSLAFDPAVTARQVPHADPREVVTMLREFYARLVLGEGPEDGAPQADLPRMRPGARLSAEDRTRALRIAEAKAAHVLDELFDKRGVCGTCHYAERSDAGQWRVAPVRITERWMPGALFTHAKHATQSCTSCHAVRDSKRASDVAMPAIGRCRECHVGAEPVLGKVTSDCAVCHRFHTGKGLWRGALPGPVPRAQHGNAP